ncbi:serine/threonine-protein kinase [Micromonospora costi]|uniref:serine/threonine-protein kinase n=1 Tax=Micromonospora costi TaxID=1530042 RepID=UPI0033E57F1D
MRQVLIAGRYRLLDLVGRGGMGRVWRARDEVLRRDVAVKQVVPPAWLADDERAELRSRTLREARTAARLNHPAVVRLYDVVEVDGEPWIVMEYVPSRTLQDVLDAEGPLAPRRAARIGLALLAALRAAHDAGVLHRDVKPQNVLVAHDGRVLLTDFGLAVFDGGESAMTRPGLVLGSPQYVAPERAAEGLSTAEADLWSLGATLHAAVEGRSPYARSTAMATLTALATAPPDPAPHAGPLAPVLAGLLRRDPARRLGHDEAERLLRAAAAGGTDANDASPRTAHDGLTRVRALRRAALVLAALVLAAAAGVGTALAVTGDDESRDQPSADRHGPRSPAYPSGDPDDGRPAPPPGGHDPPPGGRGLPPPPFPCVRPHAEGAPPPAGSPAPGETFRPPAGWIWHADTSGFRVAVPPGWRYSRDGDVACFQDPATGRTLSVTGPETGEPVLRLRAVRDRAAEAGALPGYREWRLGRAEGGTVWECGWEAPYGALLRAAQLVPDTPPGGDRWMLGWITDDGDWAGAAADWSTVRASFRPPR